MARGRTTDPGGSNPVERPAGRWHRGWLGVAVLVPLVALVVLAAPQLIGPASLDVVDQQIDPDGVTWAQGSTITSGSQTYDVGPEVVRWMLTTPHGFFLTLADSQQDDAERRFVFFDGSEVSDVPGEVSSAAVSPDGRYAGWVDEDGPWRLAGRIQEIVVVDLVSGEVVFRDHEHMGGDLGDDLTSRYSELPPTFIGFDDDNRAYWSDAEGSGTRWRVELSTGSKEFVGPDPDRTRDEEFPPVPGEPYNPEVGPPVWLSEGRATDSSSTGALGFLSPDGRFAVRTGLFRAMPVTVAETGKRVRLDHGRKWTFFGGWQEGSTVYAMVSDHFPNAFDPAVPDLTRGALVSCHLPSGECEELEDVEALRSVVFGFGDGTVVDR